MRQRLPGSCLKPPIGTRPARISHSFLTGPLRRVLFSGTAFVAIGLTLALSNGLATAMPTYDESRVTSSYTGGGTAQGWSLDDHAWPLSLPFPFPFYDRAYSTAYVSSNGYLTFDGPEGWSSYTPNLFSMKGIFVYGDDLIARHGGAFGEDVRVASSPSEVRVTWNTETYSGTATTGYSYDQGLANVPAGGSARNWHADDDFWSLDLPFAFPFFGEPFSTVYVSSNGYLTFGSGSSSWLPELANTMGIFGFGKDLITNCPDTDIYTEETSSIVRIRWQARTYNGGCGLTAPAVNVETDLYPDGTVHVLYGQVDNTGDQVIGISKGDSVNYVASPNDHVIFANLVATPEDVFSPSADGRSTSN